MSDFEVHQYLYGADNYGVLLHHKPSGATACIDCGDVDAAQSALAHAGYILTEIWLTHHHLDHTEGAEALKQDTGALVRGSKHAEQPLAVIDKLLGDGDIFQFAGVDVQVLHTPGHTTDMLNFYIPAAELVFTGDTLFTLGCGRLFEGDAAMMWKSLDKLRQLPPETTVYSAHEYTLANAAFALSVDPKNEALQQRVVSLKSLRQTNQPTVPSLLSDELATNPFLRPDDLTLRQFLDMESATDTAVFAEIRRRKDNF